MPEQVTIVSDGTPNGTTILNCKGELLSVESIDIHVDPDNAWVYVKLPLGMFVARIDIKNVTLEPTEPTV